METRLDRLRKRKPSWFRRAPVRGRLPFVLSALLLPFVCARPATLRVYVIGAEGPLTDATASVSWIPQSGARWAPEDLFDWWESGPTNVDGYFDFRGLPPGVPFEVQASPQSQRFSREPKDAREVRRGLDVIEVVDLHSGLQEVRMQIPSGSIRLELDLDRAQVLESRISLGVARVPDFMVDPSAPVTRAELPYEDLLRYQWKHSQIHRRFAEHKSWRGRSILLYGAEPGTYRAWASDSHDRLLWASEPFLVGEGMVDLGKIQVRANHPTKIAVHGFPALDPSEFPGLTILAERVPEGNASDLIYSVDGDLEESLNLIEGKHKLSLWCYSDDSSLPIAESEVFEVPATSVFTWQIPPGVLTGLPAARFRLILEDPD